MAKLFRLEVITPERVFFTGQAEAVSADATDGSITILADHEPIIMPLSIGRLKIKTEGIWSEAISSEGFLEVNHEGVFIFIQSCERPEEIDIRRAEQAKRRAEERLRQKQSNNEYKQSKIALARAMARLSAGHKFND